MFYLSIISGFIFFFGLKNKLKLSTRKSLRLQSVIVVMMVLVWAGNILYNWNYLKSYSGPSNAGYYFAYGVLQVTGYGLLATITVLLCSAIYRLQGQNVG